MRVTRPLRVTVIGRGAVAVACGARLAARGVTVAMPDARAYAVTLKDRRDGTEFRFRPNREAGDSDLTIVAVKAYQLEDKFRAASPALDGNGACLVLQNGLFEETPDTRVPAIPTLFEGTVNLVCEGEAELHALQAIRSQVAPGDLDGDLLEILRTALNFEPLDHRAFRMCMLRKFSIACTSARLVLSDLSIGHSLASPEIVRDMAAVAREAMDIVTLSDGPSLRAEAAHLLQHTLDLLQDPSAGRALADARTSMHADLSRRTGRTEIDWLNGRVVDLARETRRSAPLNAFLAESVSDLAARRLTPEDAARDRSLQIAMREAFMKPRRRDARGLCEEGQRFG